MEAQHVALYFFIGAVNLALLIWFVSSVNTIKARSYDIYEQVFELKESAQNIEKLLRKAISNNKADEEEE